MQTKTPVATRHTPVTPLKHRPDCPTAKELFAHIKATTDFAPVVRTLAREGRVEVGRVDELVDAFVQWYATGSVTQSRSYVMFAGQVDEVLHAAILNTKWYMAFCHATTGVYTHHEPIGETGLNEDEVADAAMFTARLLDQTWGAGLNNFLRLDVEKVKRGEFTAASVSCTGNYGPFDIVPVDRVR